MSSKVIVIKTAVVSGLQALPDLEGVQVEWGVPIREPQRTWVMVGDAEWQNDEWSTNRTREETIRFSIIVETQELSGTAQTTETKVAALGGAIEDWIKANPGFGIGGMVTSNFTPGRLLSWPADQMYAAQMHGELVIKAQF